MNKDRMEKDKLPQQQHKTADAQSARAGEQASQERHGEGERRPSPIEKREWRGAGVCGDRHTD